MWEVVLGISCSGHNEFLTAFQWHSSTLVRAAHQPEKTQRRHNKGFWQTAQVYQTNVDCTRERAVPTRWPWTKAKAPCPFFVNLITVHGHHQVISISNTKWKPIFSPWREPPFLKYSSLPMEQHSLEINFWQNSRWWSDHDVVAVFGVSIQTISDEMEMERERI